MSIGNVGQLAIDAILASTKAQFLTGIHHDAILPMVGLDPLDLKSKRLMTACELYKTEKALILQLRSGLIQGSRDQFLGDLMGFIEKLKVGKIIVLGSTDSEERLDSQIRGPQFRFLASKTLKSDLE